ncbi:AraC family transcriptional regulator [uncultured Phocaeicola sp.]|uniref:helix-turn-helix domain-containing protein n=1 Tax=uncultured Phocaeicola sp. TaxID=990718 RepID=UPI0025ADCE30|nr:AraC family transcriptional regulator [uncultured Phocaeicola sp.]
MDYLFLHRDKRTFTSERQKNLLFRAAHLYWEQQFAGRNVEQKRKVDCELYKYVLYYLEVRQVFLDPKLSLKKLSEMIETNQTYLSNVVNRYFGCHLKDLVNTYRVEYAKELLRSGKCPLEELPQRCGFLSRSTFYTSFKKVTGVSPKRYMKQEQRAIQPSEPIEYV